MQQEGQLCNCALEIVLTLKSSVYFIFMFNIFQFEVFKFVVYFNTYRIRIIPVLKYS
jgi:hypothetical protein